jgi:hypothetical protein
MQLVTPPTEAHDGKAPVTQLPPGTFTPRCGLIDCHEGITLHKHLYRVIPSLQMIRAPLGDAGQVTATGGPDGI